MPDTEPQSRKREDELLVLSDVAKKRREEARPDITKEPPDWLVEIRQSEVTFTLNSRLLPIRQVKFSVFVKLLEQQYNLSFEKPRDIAILYDKLGKKEQFSDEQLAELLMVGENPTLRFQNGRFPTSRDDFVEIQSLTVSDQLIYVVVRGKSQVAELVAKELAELLWKAAGAAKKWDEIEPGLKLIGFATGTVVDLGVPAINLVNSKVVTFVESEMVNGHRFSASMCPHSYRNEFKPPPSTVAVYGLDEVAIRFHVFDTTTGRKSSTSLCFRIHEREAEGTSLVYVTSEMPFDKHVECIAMLREKIK